MDALVMFAFGLGMGIILTSIVFYAYLSNKINFVVSEKTAEKIKRAAPTVVALVLVTLLIAVKVSVTYAYAPSGDTSIDVPTDIIFSETNDWIATFAPIAAIGIGITIALAVLGYIGKMIASAFKA